MKKLTSSLFFKVISLVLINSFLLLDIAWAGGTELSVVDPTEMLSAPVQISQQQFMQSFNGVYGVVKPEIEITSLDIQKQLPKKTFADRWNAFKAGLKERMNLLAQAYNDDDNDLFSGIKSIIPILLIPAIVLVAANLGWAGDGNFSRSNYNPLAIFLFMFVFGFIAAILGVWIVPMFDESRKIITRLQLATYPSVVQAGGVDEVIEVIRSKDWIVFIAELNQGTIDTHTEKFIPGQEIDSALILSASQLINQEKDFKIYVNSAYAAERNMRSALSAAYYSAVPDFTAENTYIVEGGTCSYTKGKREGNVLFPMFKPLISPLIPLILVTLIPSLAFMFIDSLHNIVDWFISFTKQHWISAVLTGFWLFFVTKYGSKSKLNDVYLSSLSKREKVKTTQVSSNKVELAESINRSQANVPEKVKEAVALMKTRNILTVCNYNFNRSQTMEMVLEHLIQENKLDKSITVSSGAVKVENRDGWGGVNTQLQEAFETQFNKSHKEIKSKMLTAEQVEKADIILAATNKIKKNLEERFGELLKGKTILVYDDLAADIKTDELENAPSSDAAKLFKTRQVIEHSWPQILKMIRYEKSFKAAYEQAKHETVTDRNQLRIATLLDDQGQPLGKEKGVNVTLSLTPELREEIIKIQKDLYESLPESLQGKTRLVDPKDFHVTLGTSFSGIDKEDIAPEQIAKLKQLLNKGIDSNFSLSIKKVGAFKSQILLLELYPKGAKVSAALARLNSSVDSGFLDFNDFDPVLYHISLGYIDTPFQGDEQKVLYDIIDAKRNSLSEINFNSTNVKISYYKNTKDIYSYELLDQIEIMPELIQGKNILWNVSNFIDLAI